MTPGHKHWNVRVRRGGIVHRLLTRPVIRTTNLPRVEASPYPYGILLDGEIQPDPPPVEPDPSEVYYLSVLSILHRWTGLCLRLPKDGDA